MKSSKQKRRARDPQADAPAETSGGARRKLAVALTAIAFGVSAAAFLRSDSGGAADEAAPGLSSRPAGTREQNFAERDDYRLPILATHAPGPSAIPAPEPPPRENVFQSADELGHAEPEPDALQPVPRPAGPRAHVIRDGDTLTRLAAKYLGHADRYREIFELNRDVLATPDLLPIGARLKIPPVDAPRSSESAGLSSPAASAAPAMDSLPLAPVPRSAWPSAGRQAPAR